MARFGSKNCCIFALANEQTVYTILKKYEKYRIYLHESNIFCIFALSFDKTDIFETYQRINLEGKSGKSICNQGR